MFTVFRQIDPTKETGADFGAEYQTALKTQRNQPAASTPVVIEMPA